MLSACRCRSRRLIAALVLGAGPVLMPIVGVGCVPPTDPNKPGDSGLTGKFVGAQRCRDCHPARYTSWSKTLHAKALETLENDGHGTDKVCLGCHVVGLYLSGGFVNRATTNSLAGVGCENCHGAGRDHADDPDRVSLQLPRSIAASVCAQCHVGCECHRGSTHPNHQLWSASGHGEVTDEAATRFAAGQSLNDCGVCHSGDFRAEAVIRGQTVNDDLLAGVATDEMNAITCVICHDPHAQTHNATNPTTGWDFQLRYPDVTHPSPCNSVAATTNSSRFSLCGQCHRTKGWTWTSTDIPSRCGVQANVFVGEMPMPDGQIGTPLVASTESAHADVAEQCSTCHMHTTDVEGAPTPDTGGHTFKTTTETCSSADCHDSKVKAEAQMITLQDTVETALADIATRLGDPSTWELPSRGGPDQAGQDALSDEIKKVRFLYHYVSADGSGGVHNPDYVKAILAEADTLLDSIGR